MPDDIAVKLQKLYTKMALHLRWSHPLHAYQYLWVCLDAADEAYSVFPKYLKDPSDRFLVRLRKKQLQDIMKSLNTPNEFKLSDVYEFAKELTFELGELLKGDEDEVVEVPISDF